MIPEHLKNKTAQQIINKISGSRHIPGYIYRLEAIAELAIEHALINADQTKELVDKGYYAAEQRAEEFLNFVKYVKELGMKLEIDMRVHMEGDKNEQKET